MSYFMNIVGTKGVGNTAMDLAETLKDLTNQADENVTRGYEEGLIGVMADALENVKGEVMGSMRSVDKRLANAGSAVVKVAGNTEVAAQEIASSIKVQA